MVDAKGRVVYVGKARDLSARLHQYFSASSSDNRFFVGLLEDTLARIDYIVAPSAKEALILENTLIKNHQPRFNVRLKDDSSFLHLKLDRAHTWPRLEVIRGREGSGECFGPYDSATALRRTLRIINRTFQLRTCTDSELARRRRPCLEYQIGRCLAPCVRPVDPEVYAERVDGVRLFLQGRSTKLIEDLTARMERAADALDFERAGRLRDQIGAIERSLAPQLMSLNAPRSLDVIGLYREGAAGMMEVMRVRDGVLVGAKAYPLEDHALPAAELTEDFLVAYYRDQADLPSEVLTSVALDDFESVKAWLSERRGRAVRVSHPRRGGKRRLVEMAVHNAREAFRLAGERSQVEALEEIAKRLKLRVLPRRIECYDISNFQGRDAVGSMVVALDGQLAPKEYRHFRIKGKDSPDDVAMLYEVLSRRLSRGKEEGGLPDLLMVDGGKGQLGAARRALKELALMDVEAVGIAKARHEDAAGRVGSKAPTGRSGAPAIRPDRFFRPGRVNPILLRANSTALYILQQLRDEAHRFAISHHKRLRAKRSLAGPLDRVSGIGPKRKRQLLRHFGSLRGVQAASVEGLAACPGVSLALARRLYAALHRSK